MRADTTYIPESLLTYPACRPSCAKTLPTCAARQHSDAACNHSFGVLRPSFRACSRWWKALRAYQRTPPDALAVDHSTAGKTHRSCAAGSASREDITFKQPRRPRHVATGDPWPPNIQVADDARIGHFTPKLATLRGSVPHHAVRLPAWRPCVQRRAATRCTPAKNRRLDVAHHQPRSRTLRYRRRRRRRLRLELFDVLEQRLAFLRSRIERKASMSSR
jgi:hypothetical protein